MSAFLILADRKAVQVDKIVGFSEVPDDEKGERFSRIVPADSQTRIDTVQGFFYTTTPFEEVVEQLLVVGAQGGDRAE